MARQPGRGANKKLTEAARHWATGGQYSRRDQIRQFERDAEQYGIPVDILLETMPDEPDQFEIWPENEESLRTFIACSTQWRIIGTRLAGLDYVALHAAMVMLGMTRTREIFDDVRNMESAALGEMNRAH